MNSTMTRSTLSRFEIDEKDVACDMEFHALVVL